MTDIQPDEPDWFSKPGDSLRSLMQRRGIAPHEVANNLRGGLTTLRGVLDGSLAIDARYADALAETVGGSRAFWLKRQENYDKALERAVNVAADKEADSWLQTVPAPEGNSRSQQKRGDVREDLKQRLTFFGVSSLKSWTTRYGSIHADTLFRSSPSFSSSRAAMILWLRKGELESDLVPTRPWNAKNLEDRLDAIRKLSRIGQPTRFIPRLRSLCAEAGVAVVFVKAPQNCSASGASRLVTSDKAMMLLSFRYRADDQFWFTVFHELGHLILHGADTFVDGDETPDDQYELEANEFASRCVIPESRRSEFARLTPDRDSVVRFSVSLGISPGLTVGQMQHHEMIPYDRLNSLKRRWTWKELAPAIDQPL